MWSHSWASCGGRRDAGRRHVGRQVAACLGEDERILVVSTTNKATDAAVLAIGKPPWPSSPGRWRRGDPPHRQGGRPRRLRVQRAPSALLRGTETELLRDIGALTRELEKADRHEDRAVLRGRIQDMRRSMKDRGVQHLHLARRAGRRRDRVQGCHLAERPGIRSMAASGDAPFTTVVIDEAGLMSRAVVAGMSLLAARRSSWSGTPSSWPPSARSAACCRLRRRSGLPAVA